MRHIILMLFVFFTGDIMAASTNSNLFFEKVSLLETMKYLPKNCNEAREALANLDQESNKLRTKDQKFVDQFILDNRGIMLSRVEDLCKQK